MSWPPQWLTPLDLEAVKRGDGEHAIAFAEAFGTIGKDGIAGRMGEPLKLRDWQKELIKALYARDKFGGYLAKTCLIGMPRKNGKSALSSAAIALYSLYAEGVDGGEVIVAAAEKEQARIVFGEAKRMVENSELSEVSKIYRDSIYVPTTNSVMKVVSAEAYSKEGANPHRVILDELHAHRDRTLFDVFRQAMGNRGGLAQLVAITTAGVRTDVTGGPSVAFTLYEQGKQIALGEKKDPTFFMAWWEAPPELDFKEPEAWAKANPGFNDLVDESDFASAVSITPEYAFRQKRLNQWTNTKQAWLPQGAWESLAEDFEILPEDEYVIGFDGAFKNDSTSIVVCILPRQEGDIYRVFRAASWEKDFATDDDSWVVDKTEVANFVLDFVQKYPNCRELAADPMYWQDEMYQWATAGIPVTEYRNAISRTVPATARLYEAILNKKLRHNNDPALNRHLANCILKSTPQGGGYLTKDYRNPTLKIDNAMALLFAYDRANARIENTALTPGVYVF